MLVAHVLGQEEFIHCKALNVMKTIVKETQVSIEVCCVYNRLKKRLRKHWFDMNVVALLLTHLLIIHKILD